VASLRANAHSRRVLEERLGIASLKEGDFRGSAYDISRRASRVLYDEHESGLAIGSAESGLGLRFACYSVFEEAPDAGKLRVQFVPRSVRPALDEQIALNEALHYLGLTP
jgi:hypothetical protein